MAERTVRPLPMAIEEIDRDWLTTALRTKAPGATVRNFETVNMIRGACTKIRYRLDMDDAGKKAGIPETIILKAGFEPHSRVMHAMLGDEVRGYNHVYEQMNLRGPKCYFADYQEELQQGVILMEDLVARGVHFCHAQRPQTHEQVQKRLTILARFHAQTWNSPDFAPGKRWAWVGESMDAQSSYLKSFFVDDVWKMYTESPRGAAVSVRFHDREWLSHALDQTHALSTRLPHVMMHGDTHLGNLYIDPDGTPGFYDMLPHHAPAMNEISYHIPCALDLADRRRWEGALIRHYLNELERNGVQPPSFDDALRQYGVFMIRGFMTFLTNSTMFQPEAVNTAYATRFSAALLDHNIFDLIKTI
jgi:hypothetical protein